MNTAPWDTSAYQRMTSAEPRGEALLVHFEDGGSAMVPFEELLPGDAVSASWELLRTRPYELMVPTPRGQVEIPWSTVRALSDPAYDAHLGAADERQSREVGRRLRALR